LQSTPKNYRQSSISPLMYLPLALLFIGQMAQAATYYVATNGNDSNSGASSAPFLTLQKAVNRAIAGDTVIIEDGTYGHVNAVTGGDGSGNVASPVWLYNSGTSSAWITIKAHHKGAAILDCEMQCDSYINLYNASYIVIQDLVITRGYKEGIHSNDAAHHITLKGNRIEYIANRSSSASYGMDGMYTNPNCHDFIIDGNVFHNIGRTSGSNSLDHGLYLHGSNYTITNNIFYTIPSGWQIQMADGLSNVLVANNTFAFANSGQNGQIMLWNTQTSVTIRNNIFYNPLSYAITRYTSSISSCSIDHNLVYGASGVISNSTGCTMGTNQVGSNPMFVNASTAPYDFHEQSGGAGIDAGMNLSAVPTDFVGNSRPQGSSTDSGAYEYLAAVTASPTVISGVFTSGIQPTSAVVNWTTDQPSTSYVQYGQSSYTNTTPADLTLVTQHSVALSNLTASTTYHFRLGSTTSAGLTSLSSDFSFTTASATVSSTTFAVTTGASQLTVAPGQAITTPTTATLLTGSATSVTFSTSPLPSGVTAGFSASSCTVTCSTTLTISASPSAAAGTYSVTVTGAAAASSASTNLALTVSATNTLAALWDFSEQKGTTTADSSGNNNTATLLGANWASNVCSGCISLTGSNSYLSVNESASLESTKQMTVSMWLRPGSNGNTDPRVISKLYSWDIKLNGSKNHPQFSAGGMYGMLNYSLSMNQWQHVVFTYSSGVLTGYVNGLAVSFAANTFTAGSTLPLQMYGLLIGTDAGKTANYKGYLDDIRIFNRPLTAAEVSQLYSTTRH